MKKVYNSSKYYRVYNNSKFAKMLERGLLSKWKLFQYNENRIKYKFIHWYYKGEEYMKNRSFIIGITFFALGMQTFTLICKDALLPSYANTFNSFSMIVLGVAFVLSLLSQKSDADARSEREDFNREVDSIYRYIDDRSRDLQDEIEDYARTNSKCADNRS